MKKNKKVIQESEKGKLSLEQLIGNPQCAVIINHSGGKDSQAMYLFVKNLVPYNRLFVIHAHLDGVEWPGTVDHIKNTIDPEHEFYMVEAVKTFFEMVDRRQMWPSPKNRQCTSDLKRGPIWKRIRQITKERGFNKVLNCMGLRAEESPGRRRKQPFKYNESMSNTKRDAYEWLPIHDWAEKAVFDFIHSNNQQAHWAYGAGMTRLSCVFCIMSSKQDIYTAAKLNPDLFQKYIEKEKSINHTLIMPGKDGPKFLDEIVNEFGKKKEKSEDSNEAILAAMEFAKGEDLELLEASLMQGC